MAFLIAFTHDEALPAEPLVRALDAAALDVGARRTSDAATYEVNGDCLREAESLGLAIHAGRDAALVCLVGSARTS